MMLVQLQDSHFQTVLRWVRTIGIGRVKQIRSATFHTLRRLSVKRDMTKAVGGIPNGSDQFDLGSFLTWLDKVKVENEEAVAQIVAVDATAHRRIRE